MKPARDPRSEYRRELKKLDDLINHGGSLSGNERNCAFLNLPTKDSRRFATVSSVTGIDFADDGRGFALADWDDDGDLDLFAMNRTGPRLRYLRNDQTSGNHYVSVKLLGRSCNRDAIGARVIVYLPQENVPNRVDKVLRAGEGFLSQSSKQLVLGLGAADRILDLTVHWPGGEKEKFAGCEIDGRYELVQGTGVARARRQRGGNRSTATPGVLAPEATERAAIFLASRVPVPRLPFRSLSGAQRALDGRKQPALINLWATWCVPCRKELKELVEFHDQAQQIGLQLLALSVDGITSEQGDESENQAIAVESVREMVQGFNQPSMFGFASRAALARLQFLDDQLFAQKRPLSVPTTFLLDSDGCLAAIYRGPVDLNVLNRHLNQLGLRGKARYDAALPFPGTWFRPRGQGPSIRLSAQMFANGHLVDAAQYTLAHQAAISGQAGFVTLAGQLASQLADRNQPQLVIDLYRAALKRDPNNVPVLNNLAWQLATQPTRAAEDRQDAVRRATQAAELTKFQSVHVLDTLARAQAAAGDRVAALDTLRRAHQLAVSGRDQKMASKLLRAIQELQD